MIFLKRYKRIFIVTLSFLLFTGQFAPINAFGSFFSAKPEPKGFFGKIFSNQKAAKNRSFVKPIIWSSVIAVGLLIVGSLIYGNSKSKDNSGESAEQGQARLGNGAKKGGNIVGNENLPDGLTRNEFEPPVNLKKGSEAIVDQWTENKAPIVYDAGYNIGFFGLEKLHPFDSKKYGKAFQSLRDFGIQEGQFLKPGMVTDEDLRTVHSQEYLDSLKSSRNVARIAEIPIARFSPNFILQNNLLDPMRKATAGTALAARLAVEHNRNFVNLGGGYHHAKEGSGGGFCFFADIPYAVKRLWETNPNLRVMVIDLDAHQGNGHEAIFKDDERVSIFDVYGEDTYPYNRDGTRQYITYNYPVRRAIGDREYLGVIERNLPRAFEQSQPDLIIYNAGTDPLDGDRVGGMHITRQGLINRDELVFRFAGEHNVPVCMVTSGGYTQASAGIISDSLKNLMNKNYLHKP